MKRKPTKTEQDEIVRAVVAGDRVEAINLYMSITHVGLTEAQEYIKGLTADIRAAEEANSAGRGKKRGCFGFFWAVAAAAWPVFFVGR